MIRESPSLETVWPEVRRRLLGFLHTRGLDGPAAEDAVQEVAVRLISREVAFSSADDLMRWAVPVARNLAVDSWRSEARQSVDPLDDVSEVGDVAQIVEHRLRLEAVRHSWGRLSERDRQALQSGVQGTRPASRSEGVRWAVQRHAARARLAAMVDGTGAFLAWLWARPWGRRPTSKRNVVVLTPLALVAVALLPYSRDLLPDVRHEQRPPLRRAPVSLTSPPTIAPHHLASAGPRPPTPITAAAKAAPELKHAVPYRRIEFASPSAPVNFIETRPKRPDDHLICIRNVRVLPDTCADLPPPLPR